MHSTFCLRNSTDEVLAKGRQINRRFYSLSLKFKREKNKRLNFRKLFGSSESELQTSEPHSVPASRWPCVFVCLNFRETLAKLRKCFVYKSFGSVSPLNLKRFTILKPIIFFERHLFSAKTEKFKISFHFSIRFPVRCIKHYQCPVDALLQLDGVSWGSLKLLLSASWKRRSTDEKSTMHRKIAATVRMDSRNLKQHSKIWAQ